MLGQQTHLKSDVVDVEEAVAAAACSREIRLHHQLSIAAKFVGGQIIFIIEYSIIICSQH